jgi:acetolactate synthase-1/2/3 large subunit
MIMCRLPERPEHNIASYAVDLVTALGSTTVFSLTGGMAMHLNRAVASHPRLKPVYCQHEQACVAAAEGYAKAADFGKAGFAVVTAGPGVSNTVTSLISANGDSTPLIVLAGQIKTADIDVFGTRTHGIQEIPTQALITPCVKRFTRLQAEGFREALVETLIQAFAGRPGPVFIEIPLDVQGVRLDDTQEDLEYQLASDVEYIRQKVSDSAQLGADDLARCLTKLLEAKRPLLYVGNGCRIAGVENEVRSFLARHSIPAVFSWLSFDIVPAQDPLYFGCPGGLAPLSANAILGRADTIVFLGARLDLGTTAFQRQCFGVQAFRYFVDIDARELSKFAGFARTECIEADLRGLPAALATAGLLSDQENAPQSAADPSWLTWCTERRNTYLEEERLRLASDKMSGYGVAQKLSRWSDGKVFVPASSGYAEETFTRFFEPGTGTRFFNGAALGSMGLGLPHAIGASFGSDRRVMCLEADGGLMLNIQELATLAHYAPKGFVLFLLNNGGYESIRASQTRHFGYVCGVDNDSGVYIPAFDKLAHAFGLNYVAVDTPDALDALLPLLTPEQNPILVDLKIERFEYRGPSVKTVIGADGKPYTTPLSEIAW